MDLVPAANAMGDLGVGCGGKCDVIAPPHPRAKKRRTKAALAPTDILPLMDMPGD